MPTRSRENAPLTFKDDYAQRCLLRGLPVRHLRAVISPIGNGEFTFDVPPTSVEDISANEAGLALDVVAGVLAKQRGVDDLTRDEEYGLSAVIPEQVVAATREVLDVTLVPLQVA